MAAIALYAIHDLRATNCIDTNTVNADCFIDMYDENDYYGAQCPDIQTFVDQLDSILSKWTAVSYGFGENVYADYYVDTISTIGDLSENQTCELFATAMDVTLYGSPLESSGGSDVDLGPGTFTLVSTIGMTPAGFGDGEIVDLYAIVATDTSATSATLTASDEGQHGSRIVFNGGTLVMVDDGQGRTASVNLSNFSPACIPDGYPTWSDQIFTDGSMDGLFAGSAPTSQFLSADIAGNGTIIGVGVNVVGNNENDVTISKDTVKDILSSPLGTIITTVTTEGGGFNWKLSGPDIVFKKKDVDMYNDGSHTGTYVSLQLDGGVELPAQTFPVLPLYTLGPANINLACVISDLSITLNGGGVYDESQPSPSAFPIGLEGTANISVGFQGVLGVPNVALCSISVTGGAPIKVEGTGPGPGFPKSGEMDINITGGPLTAYVTFSTELAGTQCTSTFNAYQIGGTAGQKVIWPIW